jgi:hypothetical protein
VAARLSKTVISRANLLLCFIFGQASPSLVWRDRPRDVKGLTIHHIWSLLFAPRRARRLAAECSENNAKPAGSPG